METPLASTAPLLAASIMPGPPPEMMPKPASLRPLAMATVSAYSCWSGFTRAEPKMEIQFLSTLFRASKAVTISAMMRNVRQDSVVEFVRSSMIFFCSSGMIFFPCPKVSAIRAALCTGKKTGRVCVILPRTSRRGTLCLSPQAHYAACPSLVEETGFLLPSPCPFPLPSRSLYFKGKLPVLHPIWRFAPEVNQWTRKKQKPRRRPKSSIR